MEPLKRNKALDLLVKRDVWWENADWAYHHPTIFLSNLMNLDTWEDTQLARKLLGDKTLKVVLREAPPGYFGRRASNYWHLKYEITPVPPLPQRKFL